MKILLCSHQCLYCGWWAFYATKKIKWWHISEIYLMCIIYNWNSSLAWINWIISILRIHSGKRFPPRLWVYWHSCTLENVCWMWSTIHSRPKNYLRNGWIKMKSRPKFYSAWDNPLRVLLGYLLCLLDIVTIFPIFHTL